MNMKFLFFAIMKYLFYFGNIRLTFCSERIPYFSRETLLFQNAPLETSDLCEDDYTDYEVDVVQVDTSPAPSGIADFRGESLEVYGPDRYYFNPDYKDAEGRPQRYARSRKEGKHILVQYLENSNYWNNSSFSVLNLAHLETIFGENDSILLHSCYTEYKGNAILFTAPSGTGKTTQAEKWVRLFGSRIVNGDLSLLYRSQKSPAWYCGGFFYHGSAPECNNETYPLKTIVILRQSPDNRVVQMSKVFLTGMLLSEMFINNWDSEQMEGALALVDHLVNHVQVLLYYCNIEDASAVVLYDYLYGDVNGTL